MTTTRDVFQQLPYSATAQKALARKPQLFINNEWVNASSDKTIAVEDPSTKSVVSYIVDADQTDVNRAVQSARTAFDDGRWTKLAPMVREQLIRKLADLIEANTDELAELESIDNGKPVTFAKQVDIPAAVKMFRYTAGWATRMVGEQVDPIGQASGEYHAYTRREPVGVAALITPWNYPLIMIANKIAPALAAGCTVVLKPAEQTSITALRFADLCAEAGFPAGVINVITGTGHTAGDMLVKHPQVDKVGFTGSTNVGKIIHRNVTDDLKHVTLELGGKSPAIVFPDVDIAEVAPAVAGAIFFNSGQTCVAGSRLYVHSSIFDEVMEGITQTAEFWAPQASLRADGNNGALVSKVQHDRVLNYIEDGKSQGASVLMGGDCPSDNGYFVNPTVLVDVNHSMRVVREEIFGPVVVAHRFDDINEVAGYANDSNFGLAASIWSKDLKTMHTLAARLQAGTIWGNCHTIIDAALPFGGYKESGIGREQGRYGVESFTETKSVIIKL